MAKVRINGDTSGYIELSAPNVAGSTSITLPATTGELAVKASDGSVDLGSVDIDSSGRLLVGTSSSSAITSIVAQGNSTNTTGAGVLSLARGTSSISNGNQLGIIDFTDSSDNKFARIEAVADAATGAGDYPGRLVFSTTADGAASPTERMQIQSTGLSRVFSDTSNWTWRTSVAAGTTSLFVEARHSASAIATGGTVSFQVYTNGNVQNTNNSYGAISDIKLKENIVDANSQWDDIKALRPVNYNFKEGQTHTQLGLIAQEVELVSPGLVSESPDRDAEGNNLGTVTKSVNYSVLYMKAVKALQEAMERIETLEAKVAALEVTP